MPTTPNRGWRSSPRPTRLSEAPSSFSINTRPSITSISVLSGLKMGRRRATPSSRGTTARRLERRPCPPAGRTRPTRTSISTQRVAFIKPSCLSMRIGRTFTPTARSRSRTATTWGTIGSLATVGSHSKSRPMRARSVSNSKTSSGSPSIIFLPASTGITYTRCGPSSAGAAIRPISGSRCRAIAGKPSPRR